MYILNERKKKLAKGSKYINNYKKHQNFIIFTLIA